MKKSVLSLVVISAIFCSASAFAINLNKIADAVSTGGDSSKNNPLTAVNDVVNKVDKLTGRIEERIGKYEKKIDAYEQKLDEAEKAINRVTTTINNFDQGQIQKYLTIVKFAVIGIAAVFGLSLLLLVMIFVQTIRINSALKKIKSAA